MLVYLPQLRLVARVWSAPVEDLLPVVNPSLRCRLSEVDLLGFVPSSKGIKQDSFWGIVSSTEALSSCQGAYHELLQFCFCLFLRAASCLRYACVRTAVQNVLAVKITLS